MGVQWWPSSDHSIMTRAVGPPWDHRTRQESEIHGGCTTVLRPQYAWWVCCGPVKDITSFITSHFPWQCDHREKCGGEEKRRPYRAPLCLTPCGCTQGGTACAPLCACTPVPARHGLQQSMPWKHCH